MITKQLKDFSCEEICRIQQAGGAAFFDRDGTINVDFGHVYRREDLVFVEGVPEILRKLNEAGIPVIVITNQAGIAKGLYTEKAMHRFNRYMNDQLQLLFGAHIDAFYFCPHRPEDHCACRKPEPGMLIRAAQDRQISRSGSIMFGDKESDRIAAEKACLDTFYFVIKSECDSKW